METSRWRRRLKRLVIIFAILAGSGWLYVEIVNRNSVNMNFRQKILKAFYPALMKAGKVGIKSKVLNNETNSKPMESFYDLSVSLNNGQTVKLSEFRGKKVLIVNTASACAYTPQYDDLQKLYERYQDRLVVIGFPANDFKEQEKGSDEDIAEFCRVNYGVTFPLATKSTVIASPSQNPVFQWLTNKEKNGWSDQPPTWNFSKFLVNEEGVLTNYFDPAVSPESAEIVKAVEKS